MKKDTTLINNLEQAVSLLGRYYVLLSAVIIYFHHNKWVTGEEIKSAHVSHSFPTQEDPKNSANRTEVASLKFHEVSYFCCKQLSTKERPFSGYGEINAHAVCGAVPPERHPSCRQSLTKLSVEMKYVVQLLKGF